jgi:hypothetical protein
VPLRLAITTSGTAKGELTTDQILEIDGDARPCDAGAGRPSAKAQLHLSKSRLSRRTAFGSIGQPGMIGRDFRRWLSSDWICERSSRRRSRCYSHRRCTRIIAIVFRETPGTSSRPDRVGDLTDKEYRDLVVGPPSCQQRGGEVLRALRGAHSFPAPQQQPALPSCPFARITPSARKNCWRGTSSSAALACWRRSAPHDSGQRRSPIERILSRNWGSEAMAVNRGCCSLCAISTARS